MTATTRAAYVCGDSTNGIIVFNSSGDPLGTNPEGDFEIFTMNMTGGDVFQVTDNAVLDSGPKWSPDCSTISYNSIDAGGSLDIHRINADGTGDVNLTNTPGVFDAFSAWSPGGTEIVFSSNRDVNFEIYSMSADDGSTCSVRPSPVSARPTSARTGGPRGLDRLDAGNRRRL